MIGMGHYPRSKLQCTSFGLIKTHVHAFRPALFEDMCSLRVYFVASVSYVFSLGILICQFFLSVFSQVCFSTSVNYNRHSCISYSSGQSDRR